MMLNNNFKDPVVIFFFGKNLLKIISEKYNFSMASVPKHSTKMVCESQYTEPDVFESPKFKFLPIISF